MDVLVIVNAAVVVDVRVLVLVVVIVAVVGFSKKSAQGWTPVPTRAVASRARNDVHGHVHGHDHDGVPGHVNEYSHVPRTGWLPATGD